MPKLVAKKVGVSGWRVAAVGERVEQAVGKLYKANDQPCADFAWKALSIREIDYYKELLEEWRKPERQEGDPEASRRRLSLDFAPD